MTSAPASIVCLLDMVEKIRARDVRIPNNAYSLGGHCRLMTRVSLGLPIGQFVLFGNQSGGYEIVDGERMMRTIIESFDTLAINTDTMEIQLDVVTGPHMLPLASTINTRKALEWIRDLPADHRRDARTKAAEKLFRTLREYPLLCFIIRDKATLNAYQEFNK